MAQVVPQEQPDPVAGDDALGPQSGGHAADPVPESGVRGGLPRGVSAPGVDDLLVPEGPRRIAQDPGGGELLVVAHGGRGAEQRFDGGLHVFSLERGAVPGLDHGAA